MYILIKQLLHFSLLKDVTAGLKRAVCKYRLVFSSKWTAQIFLPVFPETQPRTVVTAHARRRYHHPEVYDLKAIPRLSPWQPGQEGAARSHRDRGAPGRPGGNWARGEALRGGAPRLQRAPLLRRQELGAPARHSQLHRPPKRVKPEKEVWPLPPTRGRAKPAGGLTRSSAPALRLSSPVRQQPLLPPQHLPQLGEAPAPQAAAAAAARRCHAASRRPSAGQPPGPGAASAAPWRPPSYRKRRRGGRARLRRNAKADAAAG